MKEVLFKFMHRYRLIIMGIVGVFCVEIFHSFQFYYREPIFPTGLFTLDATNAVVRDLLLVGIFLFFQKNIIRVKQVAKDYSPIMIVAILWLSIATIIINALKLNFHAITIISVFTGLINNTLFVLLAGYLCAGWNNAQSKIIYFLAYLSTIMVFYLDAVYFLVRSTHIEQVVFENLNRYALTGVLYTADKTVLFGILVSFFFLALLFRTPKNNAHTPQKLVGVAIIILICVITNLVNIAMADVYPKVLAAGGFNLEGELEQSRNLSRDLLAKSVTMNLVREFLRTEARPGVDPLQFHREAFSDQEKQLLSKLGIKVDKISPSPEKTFPYEKIVVIVAESFHRDYLHFYNSRIPAETTQFLDGLFAAYPHVDNYYTSNSPTTQGLNSMFLSQLLYSEEQDFENNVTLFKTLERNGYGTVFMDATSQYYNDEFRAYKKRFGMQTYRAKEDLEKQGYSGSTGWGFHNDVMYEETIRIMEENRGNKFFIVTKTIDSHQPGLYCGVPNDSIPAAVKEQNNLYLKGIYWENVCMQKFFHDLEERKLLDDKTLIIITSDHNPHPSQDDYKSVVAEEMRLYLAPIPLIFVSKNLQPFENFSSATFASQVDFAPTILGILGIPSPPEFSGRNIIEIPEEQSYAIGSYGETLIYRAKDRQIRTDMYKENDNAYEKALIHWTMDSYAGYFPGSAANLAGIGRQN